jgi:putative endonuclease
MLRMTGTGQFIFFTEGKVRLMMERNSANGLYYVYIMSSEARILYTGVTNDLVRRVYQHKNGLLPGFTSKYKIERLVYFETTSDVRTAISREKQIKGWMRKKKIELIESVNPGWEELQVN